MPIMRLSVWLITFCLLIPLTLAGCGGSSTVKTVPSVPPECELFRPASQAADTITFVLFDNVELAIAPWARNPSEKLLFHHLYETLTVVDCLGSVRAGLATSWKKRDAGRHWVFDLRTDARFWDGTPVTAGDIVTSWQELAVEPQIINTLVDSLATEGNHVLHVYLSRPKQDVPHAFSALEFAVVKSSDTSAWPLGSGPYRIVSVERRSASASRHTVTVEPSLGFDRPVIRFVETSARDARDLLEGTADVMVTGDPAVLAYAARHPQLATAPLPWTRTHVLVSTSRVVALHRGRTLEPVSPILAAGLARDAVRSDARGYQPTAWWDDRGSWEEESLCDVESPVFDEWKTAPNLDGLWGPPEQRRILYDTNDPTARELAERLVALASADPGVSPEAEAVFAALPGLRADDATDLTTGGVPEKDLASSLRAGGAFAYVVSISRRTPNPCAELDELMHRVPWLAVLGNDFAKGMIPLTDTREHVIVNGTNIGLDVDWFGNVLITAGPPRRSGQRGFAP